jgi:ABC-type transport system involved in cytochrome c biogenesis ATPase subunit
MTAHQRQAAFRVHYQQQLDDNFSQESAGRETRFRLATLALAELALCQIAQELSRPQGADALLKLMVAALRAQGIGLAALSRPAKVLDEVPALDASDWVLMREIRRGARMDPEWDSPVS